MNDRPVSNVAVTESDAARSDDAGDLLDAAVGGVGKSLYERNHDNNPFNDGPRRGRLGPYDGPGPFDRPFVDDPGPGR